MVAPQITATAADAAVSVLCDGNPLLREIFYSDDHISLDKHKCGNLDMEMERYLDSFFTDSEL